MYYLGPEGSFTYEVAVKLGKNLVGVKSITEVFRKVEDSENSIGVIPIENSKEGPINETLDNLFNNDKIFVNYEIEKDIKLVFASKSPEINQIKRIYTNYYAGAEVREFISRLNKEVIYVSSTSEAAKLASSDPAAAAICSEYAARIWGLNVLESSLQEGINITRFIVISKRMTVKGDKTMIFLTIPDVPGSLYKSLEKFYKYNINLKMIYSRPLKYVPWEYYFYLEFQGELEDNRVKKALEELREVVISMKIKGSFTKLRFQA
ncbi:MAG: prephenate dehydratase domain-containing protein [Sulfolobaceae archaeon]